MNDFMFAPRCETCWQEMEMRYNGISQWWECPSHPYVKAFASNNTSPTPRPSQEK